MRFESYALFSCYLMEGFLLYPLSHLPEVNGIEIEGTWLGL